jgi:hypothetical protein
MPRSALPRWFDIRSLLLPLGVVVACDGTPKDTDTGPLFAGPNLVHTPPAAAVEGTGVTLEVTAADPDGVASVTLFHRVAGETTWVQAPMIEGEGGVWTAELESSDVDDPALEYYFKAEDAADTPALTYLPEGSTADPFELLVTVIGSALPFLESFEHDDTGDLGDLGWGSASVGFRGYGWETSTTRATDGARSVYHSRGHSDAGEIEDWLITPALDFREAATAQVTWQELGVGVEDANHGLYVSTGSRDPDAGDYVAVAELLPAPPEGAWARSAVYDLSAYAGSPTVYLAWRFEGQNADDWYIDDVRVDLLQPDLVLDTSVTPAPIEPGETGTFAVTIDNVGIVDASGLTVSVVFPDGGATVAEAGVEVASVPVAGAASADFALTIDGATANNSYLPYEVTVTDGDTTWSASGEMIVGLASTAAMTWSPSAEGSAVLTLGVGNPDAPTWEQVIYDDRGATPVDLVVDITENGALLPPAAGDVRWFLRVDSDIAGTIDAFSIAHDGVTYTASELARVDADASAVIWLPEPPSFDVTATSSPSQLTPGATGASLGLYVVNTGAATQGGVTATLSSSDPDITITDAGPVTLTGSVLEAGTAASVSGVFAFDIAVSHTDSSPVDVELTLDDGVESWTLPLELAVPYPYLTISDIDIDDDDRDGELDVGESAELDIQLTNAGDLPTNGDLAAVLTVESSSTASATISTDPIAYRNLLAGRSGSGDDPWEIEVTGGAEGDSLNLLLTLTDDARTYEVRTTLRLGEPPWESFDPSGDPSGDALGGWDFDIVGGEWRVNDGLLQIKLESSAPYDPTTLFVESWGYSTVARWTYYRIVLQSGVATLEGYDAGFTTIATLPMSYPSATEVQVDIELADMELSLDTLSLGFASGWCGPDSYYCDHFPNNWGYPYDTWSPTLFFDLSW